MAIGPTDRVGVILDLLKDGDVPDESLYAGLEKATPGLITRVAQSVYFQQPPVDPEGQVIPFGQLGQEDRARVILNTLRRNIENLMAADRVPAARNAAAAAERSSVAAEVLADLGGEE